MRDNRYFSKIVIADAIGNPKAICWCQVDLALHYDSCLRRNDEPYYVTNRGLNDNRYLSKIVIADAIGNPKAICRCQAV